MTKKEHILINLGQLEDEAPKPGCEFKVYGVINTKRKRAMSYGYRTQEVSKISLVYPEYHRTKKLDLAISTKCAKGEAAVFEG